MAHPQNRPAKGFGSQIQAPVNKEAERIAKANQSYDLQIETLGLQLEAVEAITREEEKQAELQLRLLRLREANKDLAPEQLAALEEATRKLFEATNLSPLDAYIKNTSKALADTEMQLLSVVQTVEGQLASGISNFFNSIVDGSKSAEEAFADMLKGMGQALVQQGAIMIAQYIAIGVARLFAGMGGGIASGGFGTGSQAPLTNGLDFTSAFLGQRATGGPVGADRPYMVGENGPELFVPRTSGTVVNNEDTRSALGRYNSGNNDMVVNYSPNIQSTTINGQEYVTVEQMNMAVTRGMETAAKKGAQGGFVRTMSSLKNNRSNRKTIGL